MYYLFEKNWLMKKNAGKSLSVVMDNCGGQNKNNNVLRLAPHLIKMGYFRSCEFDFYIRGHTKNVCDRLFNQMKIRFHKRDLYLYKNLLEIIGAQENVTIIDATEDFFLDYGKFLDEHYNSFKAGTINKNHIFQCDDYDATELNMKCKTHDGAEVVSQPMLKRGIERSGERLKAMATFKMETLQPPGLRSIKQVELFKKIRLFVPRAHWAELCPEPSEEAMDMVKQERSYKRK
jgi:hypothetical protein